MSKKVSGSMKIIFFHIMRENFSGAQKNIYRLLINLDRKEVTPVLIGQSQCPLTKLTSEISIDTRIIPFPKELEIFDGNLLKFNFIKTFKFFKGIWKYNQDLIEDFKQIEPEIVWCDNIRTLITIYIATRKVKAKIIWNIWSEPEGKIAWIVHRVGLLLADKINTEYEGQGKKIFGKIANLSSFKEKIIPIYTGVSDFEKITGSDIRKELALPSEAILIIMASSILQDKGQIDLIKSFEMLLKESKKVFLLIAGSSVKSSPKSIKYEKKILNYVKENNLNDSIHFIGWRSDIRNVLSKSDIYVSTSYSESLPDAVREAMLVSLPVVVTNVGGTGELVDLDENGFLFEPGDQKSLTKYLKRLVDNPSKRKEMGLKSKAIIENKYSTKLYARNFENMLKKTIDY